MFDYLIVESSLYLVFNSLKGFLLNDINQIKLKQPIQCWLNNLFDAKYFLNWRLIFLILLLEQFSYNDFKLIQIFTFNDWAPIPVSKFTFTNVH